MDFSKKGDWRIERHGLTYPVYSGDYEVAKGIYNKKNAQLIAAAPDMYEALKHTLFWFSLVEKQAPKHSTLRGVIDKALAKAEGKC